MLPILATFTKTSISYSIIILNTLKIHYKNFIVMFIITQAEDHLV